MNFKQVCYLAMALILASSVTAFASSQGTDEDFMTQYNNRNWTATFTLSNGTKITHRPDGLSIFSEMKSSSHMASSSTTVSYSLPWHKKASKGKKTVNMTPLVATQQGGLLSQSLSSKLWHININCDKETFKQQIMKLLEQDGSGLSIDNEG